MSGVVSPTGSVHVEPPSLEPISEIAVRWVRESGDDLADLRLVTDGRNVWACRDDGQILDALRAGQLALFVAVDRVAADVDAEVRAFTADRAAFVERLRQAGDPEARTVENSRTPISRAGGRSRTNKDSMQDHPARG